ncbi:hypothetical protein BHE74_00036115 [Ensete ventricosum]|uniref:lipid-A-disaccharide synthase n=1 Tax=Ensete ventricosum TaxID=4639 RepID=A0A426YUP4_ENSVE|nr:hypothetical protein B296_00044682 [Ensete ventricosum]RWW57117.1 hypothetical protein BHE74_00036115 [Ensete ventricosum]RZS19673.1 hypothetical protein BHM03_00052104 [Ensete ventricosum]
MLLRPIEGQPNGGLGGRFFVSWRIASKSGLSSYTNASSSSSRIIDMAAREGELRVFMVAGEVSGDSIASRLMASLKKLSPFPVRFAGVGGLVRLLLSSILLTFVTLTFVHPIRER